MNKLLKLFSLLLIFSISSCIDQEFDEPPVDGEDPGITPNATVADLKALYKAGQIVPITQDLTIGGVVVADDRSGNYFRSFILQDATAGIEVRINQTSAYNFYPIGRQLFIKCKGLVIGDYNGVAQLGGYTYIEDGATQLGDIIALNEHILKGKRVGTPAPKVKKINELTTADISTLIKLENVEFASTDANLPFADVIGRASLNRAIKDCNGNSILLRTSGYATFANTKTPQGNGSVVAIYSVFGRDKQLFIRELTDIVMDAPRCTGGGGSTGNETVISLQEVRNLFKGGTKAGPAGRKITGVVISDRASGNWDNRNLVVQDSTGGIALRFASNHSFNLGDAIEVVISGQELSEFNGLLQVNNLDNNLAKKIGAGTLPAPRVATVADIKANLENWESTLVRVKSATLTGGSTYSGSRKVNDASGNIDLFTRSQANFATQSLPTGTVEVVAVVSQFNAGQLLVRGTADVTSGNGGGGGDTTNTGGPLKTLDESFNSVANNQDIALSGWKNIVVKGTRLWRGGIFQGNGYAQATAFQDVSNEMETWLITPQIDLAEAKILSFESAQAFFKHNGLSVFISTNFDGTNVGSATWTPLTAKLAGSTDANYTNVPSGDIDLSAYTGKGYIGFKYVGDKTNNTTTYRIDNVKIRKK
jgi:hypothetical protein